jgi:L-fuconolactonase
MTAAPAIRIDAHQHFWKYTKQEFDWIDDAMSMIRRDFLPSDLVPLLQAKAMDATIVVQARQSLEETDWLLSLAETTPWIMGVVGWLPLASPNCAALLDHYSRQPKLRGLRHVLQAEDDAYFEDANFHQGLGLLRSYGLVYDLLIVERQMKPALRFVDRHPDQIIVLDHLAKPRIAVGELLPWATHLRELARREHVVCKLSGLVTEADYHQWSVAQLKPFVEVALEVFGPSRLLFGSDWPVCTVAASYQQWCETAEEMLSACTSVEREAIFGLNAQRVYGLSTVNKGILP